MKITKLGHCCLLIEANGKKIMTDPGVFSTSQDNIKGVDIVVITHEHTDHFHVESLKKVLGNNPNARVVTNSAVGRKLDTESIAHTVLEGTSAGNFESVSFVACDHKHEEIFEEYGQVQNTGYFIANELFYPGDAFADPGKPVPILALPVAGPWCKISDALHYALRLKPKKAFPVHDGVIADSFQKNFHKWPQEILGKEGIEFVSMISGDTHDF